LKNKLDNKYKAVIMDEYVKAPHIPHVPRIEISTPNGKSALYEEMQELTKHFGVPADILNPEDK